mmetsp:Transcript_1543/g.3468  ORF Transcript_1543/g.3468 Transcript_1543/m.3468 type:complete len:101 (+) Transcript_1543:249-551(+)
MGKIREAGRQGQRDGSLKGQPLKYPRRFSRGPLPAGAAREGDGRRRCRAEAQGGGWGGIKSGRRGLQADRCAGTEEGQVKLCAATPNKRPGETEKKGRGE